MTNAQFLLLMGVPATAVILGFLGTAFQIRSIGSRIISLERAIDARLTRFEGIVDSGMARLESQFARL